MDIRSFTYDLIDDTNNNRQDVLASFATDDLLCELVGSQQLPPVIRLWTHEQSVVLGIMDMKLPKLQDGLKYLKEKGFKSRVRNSGGLAVVLDEGVINLTLLLPEEKAKIQIDTGYEFMWNLIKLLLKEYDVNVEAKEIVGSYCPGSYDLSIDGKKFAGISQRRIKKAMAVQIYVCLTGSGSNRAEMIKEFYDESDAQHADRPIYPQINPSVMASLNELLQVEFEAEEWKKRIVTTLETLNLVEKKYNFDVTTKENYEFYYNRIKERNEHLL